MYMSWTAVGKIITLLYMPWTAVGKIVTLLYMLWTAVGERSSHCCTCLGLQ